MKRRVAHRPEVLQNTKSTECERPASGQTANTSQSPPDQERHLFKKDVRTPRSCGGVLPGHDSPALCPVRDGADAARRAHAGWLRPRDDAASPWRLRLRWTRFRRCPAAVGLPATGRGFRLWPLPRATRRPLTPSVPLLRRSQVPCCCSPSPVRRSASGQLQAALCAGAHHHSPPSPVAWIDADTACRLPAQVFAEKGKRRGRAMNPGQQLQQQCVPLLSPPSCWPAARVPLPAGVADVHIYCQLSARPRSACAGAVRTP
jgi:hypothetical protein